MIGRLVLCLAMGIGSPALADVSVVDGDTITVDGETFDLYGIVAPGLGQTCPDGWPAGIMAADVLRELVRDHKVTCEPKTSSRYSPSAAVCLADGLDLGSLMVRSGWAWAFVRYTTDYLPQEVQARAALAGVHGHNCAVPWEWRARDPR